MAIGAIGHVSGLVLQWIDRVSLKDRSHTCRNKRAAGLAAAASLVSVLAGNQPAMAQNMPSFPAFACPQTGSSIALVKREGSTSTAPECLPVDLPVPFESVRWATWVPGDKLANIERIALERVLLNNAFEYSSARLDSKDLGPPHPKTLAVGQSLVKTVTPRPFGVEERVAISSDNGQITLTCRDGNQPAGVILDPGAVHIPQGATLAVRWSAEGDSGFKAGLTRSGASAEAVQPLRTGEQSDLAVPEDPSLRDAPWFVVACPDGAGSIRISDFQLVPSSSLQKTPIPKAAWAWKPALWKDDPEALLQRTQSLGLSRLFVSVDIEGSKVKDAATFREFVKRAQTLGIAVVVVEGDPEMVLEAGRAAALSRLAALDAYQKNADPVSRIAGVQYDIEPYLLPAFATNPADILEGWSTTVRLLRQATDMELDLVLPFWLPGHELAAASLLPSIKTAANRITVMAYRTNPQDLQAAAELFLSWGSTEGVPVHVALEAGPIPEEKHHIYRPAPHGELLLVPQGDRALLLLLEQPNQDATQFSFAFSHTIAVPGSGVSFLGDTGRMIATADEASDIFRAWPSFAGVAFHGLVE